MYTKKYKTKKRLLFVMDCIVSGIVEAVHICIIFRQLHFKLHIQLHILIVDSDLLKQCRSLNIKAAKPTNRKILLLQCKKHTNRPLGRSLEAFKRRLTFRIVNCKKVNCLWKCNNKSQQQIRPELHKILPYYIITEYNRRLSINYNRIFHTIIIILLTNLST